MDELVKIKVKLFFKKIISFFKKEKPVEKVEVVKYQRMFPKSGVGFEAQEIFKELMDSLKIPCDWASDFEDEKLGIDFWIRINGKEIPIDLTIVASGNERVDKRRIAYKKRVMLVYSSLSDLEKTNSKYNPETFKWFQKEFLDSLINQLRGGLKQNLITREEAKDTERYWLAGKWSKK